MHLNLAQKLLDLLLSKPFRDHVSFNANDNCWKFPLFVNLVSMNQTICPKLQHCINLHYHEYKTLFGIRPLLFMNMFLSLRENN